MFIIIIIILKVFHTIVSWWFLTIIIIIIPCEFFSPALADGFPLESERLRLSSRLPDSS